MSTQDSSQAAVGTTNKQRLDAVYNSESSDVKLVASNGVVFLVQSYHLLSASVGFRELLKANLPTPPTEANPEPRRVIELVDPEFEYSHVVRTVLDYIQGRWLPEQTKYPRDSVNVLQFLHKWNFADQYRRFILWSLPKFLLTPCRDGRNNYDVEAEEERCQQAFILACRFDMEQVVECMIRHIGICCELCHRRYTQHTLVKAMFDPADMTPSEYHLIGPKYTYALNHAYTARKTDIDNIRTGNSYSCRPGVPNVNAALAADLRQSLNEWKDDMPKRSSTKRMRPWHCDLSDDIGGGDGDASAPV